MMKKINLYFFGAGQIIDCHIMAAKQFDCFNLYGICSRTHSKAEDLKKKYKIKYNFRDINELHLDKNYINIAIVGVNIEKTKSVFKKIFKSFDICLLEKPVGFNLKEATQIYDISKLSKTKFYVSLNRRFYSSSIQLQNFLKKDKSKRLLNIVDTETPNLYESRFPKKILSNWMFANSIHLIDYINQICRGKINFIKLNSSNDKNLRVFNLKFSSGDLCTYTQIWNRPGPWSVSVSTKKKFFKLEPLEKLIYRSNDSFQYREIKIEKNDLDFKPGFVEIYRNLKLTANKKNSDLIKLKDSLKLMKLIDQLKKIS